MELRKWLQIFLLHLFSSAAKTSYWNKPKTLTFIHPAQPLHPRNPETFLWIAVVLIVCITRVAKAALDKALAENEDYDDITSGQLPVVVVADVTVDLKQPLILKIDPTEYNHEKWQSKLVVCNLSVKFHMPEFFWLSNAF